MASFGTVRFTFHIFRRFNFTFNLPAKEQRINSLFFYSMSARFFFEIKIHACQKKNKNVYKFQPKNEIRSFRFANTLFCSVFWICVWFKTTLSNLAFFMMRLPNIGCLMDNMMSCSPKRNKKNPTNFFFYVVSFSCVLVFASVCMRESIVMFVYRSICQFKRFT